MLKLLARSSKKNNSDWIISNDVSYDYGEGEILVGDCGYEDGGYHFIYQTVCLPIYTVRWEE